MPLSADLWCKSPARQWDHRTVLTNRAINAFFPCKADAIHTGLSRLMHMQHNSPDPPLQERDNFAARRQRFSAAAVRNGPKDRNPNRPFAAGVFGVSVANFATCGSYYSKGILLEAGDLDQRWPAIRKSSGQRFHKAVGIFCSRPRNTMPLGQRYPI